MRFNERFWGGWYDWTLVFGLSGGLAGVASDLVLGCRWLILTIIFVVSRI